MLVYGIDLTQQNQSFSFRMREITKLFARAMNEHLKRFGVTTGQWYFLRALWEREGVSQQYLSNRLGMSSAATVFSINLLERDKLAERLPDHTDKRRYCIYLTPRGKHLREELLPFAREVQLRALDGFTDAEVRQLSEMLGRIKVNLEGIITEQGGEPE